MPSHFYKGNYARPGPARDSNISIATAPPQAPRGDWDDLFADSKKRELERGVGVGPAGLLKHKHMHGKGKQRECGDSGGGGDGEVVVEVDGEAGPGVHGLAQHRRSGSNVTV